MLAIRKGKHSSKDMNSALRILFAVHGYKPAYRVGGPILSVSAAAEKLVSRGHKVTVFTSNSNLDEDLDVSVNQAVMVNGVEVWYFERREPLKKLFPNFKYISQSMGYLYSPMMLPILQKKIYDFDLVHNQMPFVYPTYIAGREAIRAGKPLFYSQRSVFDPNRLKFRGFKKMLYIMAFERPLMRKATTLIALTEAERSSFRALRVNTPCHIVPNGIDTNQYRRKQKAGFDASLRIRSDQTVILFLARFHKEKGADILLKAFVQISNRFPKAILIMAGPDQHGTQNQLKKLVKHSNIGDRVLFPGMVSGDLKLDLLARADLFCLPSVAEGFSMVILEALASATPVMITPGCHFPEVEARAAGWIIERSVDEWVEGLSSVLQNPDQLMSAGEAALNLVKSSYTWDRVVNQLEEVYQEGLLRVYNQKNR